MKPIVIGSVALDVQLNQYGFKGVIHPGDTDIIVGSFDQFNEFVKTLKNPIVFHESLSEKFNTQTIAIKVETDIIEITYPIGPGTTLDLFNMDRSKTCDLSMDVFGIDVDVVNIDVLYTLKMSHIYLKNSPHFKKTMVHTKNIRKLGAKIFSDEFYKARIKETYDYSHPNLNVKKNEFFTNNFNYIYDHDSIHEAVKVLDNPAYTYYMNGEVGCSKSKFFELPSVYRYLGVIEEALVLALERSQIPTDFKVDPEISFDIALEKVCTSITSGWFREFAWENYDVIRKIYNDLNLNYVKTFKDALASGNIKMH